VDQFDTRSNLNVTSGLNLKIRSRLTKIAGWKRTRNARGSIVDECGSSGPFTLVNASRRTRRQRIRALDVAIAKRDFARIDTCKACLCSRSIGFHIDCTSTQRILCKVGTAEVARSIVQKALDVCRSGSQHGGIIDI
jgi:hypothetical protein